jgi:ubiquinone/menaquinone biosynthesis C-methylase UbiE
VVDGRSVQHAVAMAPTPHNVSYIWWAPNHVRAFPRHSVGVIRAADFLEHVADKVALINELYRLLAPEGCCSA